MARSEPSTRMARRYGGQWVELCGNDTDRRGVFIGVVCWGNDKVCEPFGQRLLLLLFLGLGAFVKASSEIGHEGLVKAVSVRQHTYWFVVGAIWKEEAGWVEDEFNR